MSDTTDETTESPADTPQEGDGKTFDADYVEKLRKENAKYRTEAKANADAAKRLAEIEEAQKTEAQKAADRLAEAEKAAEDAKREALKFKVAAKFQISDDDADLFLTGSDEETLTKQAERLAGREAERKQNGNVSPREGNNPKPGEGSSEAQFARSLFASSP